MKRRHWIAKLMERVRSLASPKAEPRADRPDFFGPSGAAAQRVQVTRIAKPEHCHGIRFGVVPIDTARPVPHLSPDVTSMVVGTGIALFLLVAVLLFWEPITSVLGGCIHRVGGTIVDARENSRYRSLQRTVETRLSQAQRSLDNLEVDYLAMDRRVQAIIGRPLKSAIADPPQPLRSAIYTREDVSEAWYTLRKAAATLEEIPLRQAELNEIVACIGHQTLNAGHPYQVQQIIDWINTRHQAIKAIDFAFIPQDTTYRLGNVVLTGQRAERRQTR